MVKGEVNDTVTYYPGRHYNKEVKESTTLVLKFYAAAGQTVAVRSVQDAQDVLRWMLSDHLGSASVTANLDGTWNSTIQYTAFGEVRARSGITPGDYRYTGQLEQAELGLYYYVARWYDPALGRFAQADSIIPQPGDPREWDRYGYVRNNPILYTDPSGHMILVDDNLFVRDDRKTGDHVIINSCGLGKFFANYVEEAAANVLLKQNPRYLMYMPQNTPGFSIGATFEGAARQIGIDLGNYYTTFVNLMTMIWGGISGTRYPGANNNSTPYHLQRDALGDPDCVGCGFRWNKSNFDNVGDYLIEWIGQKMELR